MCVSAHEPKLLRFSSARHPTLLCGTPTFASALHSLLWPLSLSRPLGPRSLQYTKSSTLHVTVCAMSMPRTAVSSLVRRAFAARRSLDVTSSSSCCHPAFSGMLPTPSYPNTTAGAGMGCCSQQNQQRAGLSTLRRGLTGPLSSRLRLPMRGLEEFRDPEIVKVCMSMIFICAPKAPDTARNEPTAVGWISF